MTNANAAGAYYFRGDLAIATGKTVELHGATFYEYKLVEGHRAGDLIVTQNAPKGAK